MNGNQFNGFVPCNYVQGNLLMMVISSMVLLSLHWYSRLYIYILALRSHPDAILVGTIEEKISLQLFSG